MSKFFPGWRMTVSQHQLYFRLLGQVYAKGKITNAAEREAQRQLMHFRAFGRKGVSAKDIDHQKMFDAFVAECMTWIKPDDLDAQLKQVDQPLIRLRHRILEFPHAYVIGLLCSPRFKRAGLEDLNRMSEKELTDLRNTLCARAPQNTKPVEQPF